MYIANYASPVGELTLSADEGHLTGLHFEGALPLTGGTGGFSEGRPNRPRFAEVMRQLDAYFEGRLRRFDVPLRFAGTPFQRSVWEALCRIDYADTWSYQRLAEQVGRPRAMRAVGASNGKNPIAIIVPCHRVIGKDGSLTGFGGGLDRKQFLLDLEKRRSFP